MKIYKTCRLGLAESVLNTAITPTTNSKQHLWLLMDKTQAL